MEKSNLEITRKIMLKLLPVQVILAMVGAVNGLVSSYFASNYIGIDAMSAVGLYGPASMLLGAVSTVLVGGSAIICGKYLGQNDKARLQNLFSLVLMLNLIIAARFTALFVLLALTDMTWMFTRDKALRPIFNRYLLGQTIGIIPMFLGNQLPMFLTAENMGKRTMQASLTYIIVNLILDYLFIQVLDLQEFGLALASSVGMWIFCTMEIMHFISPKSNLRIRSEKIDMPEIREIISIGFSGAVSSLFQTIRGLIVNKLLEIDVGSMGLSAFAAANNLMGLFWAFPAGMYAVSRLQISVALGEEDRQTLADIMKVMFTAYIPIMCVIDVVIILMAGPLSSIFFGDPSVPAYEMMKSGLQILPLCMPFSIICMHFGCYGQLGIPGLYDELLSLLDGVVCVAGFSYLLIGWMGINGVYVANVLNGIVTTVYIVVFAWIKLKHVPHTMEELMIMPADFGVGENDRIDITVNTMEEVVTLSQQIQQFCREKGIDEKRSYLAALATEEMAGNIVDHGFTKDNKDHAIYVRVLHKGDNVILRIRDDCIPFNPEDRKDIFENGDITKNIGVRMIYKILKDINYQYLFGMNVLLIKI